MFFADIIMPTNVRCVNMRKLKFCLR